MDTAETPDLAGICRLCLEPHPLVRSHIIPDFQFRELKERDGYFFLLSTDPTDKERKQQRGPTERLLCARCDNVRLQRNEDYFARLWSRAELPNTVRLNRFLVFRDHDYKRVKNFLLSVLWRMSVSSSDMFEEVSLGKKHEESLRVGLLEDREFEEDEFPVTITAPYFEKEFFKDLILPPSASRMEGNKTYRCVIAGMFYTFFVGSAALSKELKALSLRRDEMPVLKADVLEIPFLRQAIYRLSRANSIRERSTKS
jgi:hypothetical protein